MNTENQNQNESGTRFVFRKPAGVTELEALFRLRYEVYRGGRLSRFVAENPHGMDFDAYDLRAHHFGLFEVTPSGEKPVGYIRLIEDRDLSAKNGVAELLGRFPGLRQNRADQASVPFPLMSYSPDTPRLTELYNGIVARGERVVEAARMTLDEHHRSLRLARYLFESVATVCYFVLGFDYALAFCDATKKGFYRCYGLNHIEGTTEGDFVGLGVDSTLLLGSAGGVTGNARERMLGMAHEYRSAGQIAQTVRHTPPVQSVPVIALRPVEVTVACCA